MEHRITMQTASTKLRTGADCFARAAWTTATRQSVLLRLAVGLWLTFTLIVFLVVIASRIGTPIPKIKIDEQLLPGHSLPKAASCDTGDPEFHYLSYCEIVEPEDHLILLTFDWRTQVIRNTVKAADRGTLGDLVVAWGNPNGYRLNYQNVQIFWGEKSAFVSVPLTPSSQAKLLVYYLDATDMPQDRLAWRGFVTIDSAVAACSARH